MNLILDGSTVGRLSLLSMPRVGIAAVSLPLRSSMVVGNTNFAGIDSAAAIRLLQRNMMMDIRMVRYQPAGGLVYNAGLANRL